MMPHCCPSADLSVIVVTHNRTELALRTIRSARAAAGALTVDWHVIDSGSVEPTVESVQREWPDVDVLRFANVGFATANNQGLRHARGRYVLLLNPDVEIARGTLAELVAALDDRPTVGMASVIQRRSDGALDYSIRRDPSPWRTLGEAILPQRLRAPARLGEVVSQPRRYRREQTVDWVGGAFLVARAEALRDIGGLDERFFMYSEETDWCYRCRRAGWEVRHLPVIEVVHHRSHSYGPDLLAQLSWSKMLFARKHLGRRAAAAMRVALALRHGLRAVSFTALARVDPRAADRARAQTRALAVVLGRASPPFNGMAAQ
ncbi:MAG: glycosyltransferase family 2 protein [Solirubrobacteraceae bacterium]